MAHPLAARLAFFEHHWAFFGGFGSACALAAVCRRCCWGIMGTATRVQDKCLLPSGTKRTCEYVVGVWVDAGSSSSLFDRWRCRSTLERPRWLCCSRCSSSSPAM